MKQKRRIRYGTSYLLLIGILLYVVCCEFVFRQHKSHDSAGSGYIIASRSSKYNVEYSLGDSASPYIIRV